MLDFKKFEILTAGMLLRCTVPNFLAITWTVTVIWRFINFQNDGHLLSWICRTHVWTTHKEYLVVYITVQNCLELISSFDTK